MSNTYLANNFCPEDVLCLLQMHYMLVLMMEAITMNPDPTTPIPDQTARLGAV